MMARRNSRINPFVIAAALLLTSLGIGWLTGLSVSPVVSTVITNVTVAVAAIVAALSELGEQIKCTSSKAFNSK